MNSIVALPIAAALPTSSPLLATSEPDCRTIATRRRRTLAEDDVQEFTATVDDMDPRYRVGEMGLYNRSLRPIVGDEVFIRTKSGTIMVRNLLRFDGRKLKLLQHNPKTETDFLAEDVEHIYPCVTYEPPAFSKDGRPVIEHPYRR